MKIKNRYSKMHSLFYLHKEHRVIFRTRMRDSLWFHMLPLTYTASAGLEPTSPICDDGRTIPFMLTSLQIPHTKVLFILVTPINLTLSSGGENAYGFIFLIAIKTI